MNIPEILKGKEAVGFLSLFCSEDFTNEYEIAVLKELDVIAYFLNQPFRAEMITEYFEGMSDTRRLANIKIIAGIDALTLDQFITDCQRAGIKLTYKNN